MAIARLDNEVFFKKAFTDRIVFKSFVKDIVGIDVEPDKIETEKPFNQSGGTSISNTFFLLKTLAKGSQLKFKK